MNLLDATANSVNTIFAQLVDAVGPENVVPMAHRLGITLDAASRSARSRSARRRSTRSR